MLDCVHDRIPRGRKENVWCIIHNAQNMALRQAGKRSNFEDDCGVWDSSKGKTTVLPYMKTSIGEYKRLFVKNGLYGYEHIVKGCRMFEPVTPQPDADEVFLLGRHYTAQKGNPDYRKRVSWIDQQRSGMPIVAVVEYLGKAQVSKSHGNTQNNLQVPYLRTPAATMERVCHGVANGASCKQLYDTIVGDTADDQAPRNSRVIRNQKYVQGSKRRRDHNGVINNNNVADEVQQVCSMVVQDNYVQSVTLTRERAPMVILYNDRQLAEIRSFCTNKTVGSVLSVDKTYNLGRFYVTVTVYRNLALQRNGTQTTPSFIGPLFFHSNSDFETYCVFFGHLSARLSSCCFSDIRIGSDEEQAIRKAAAHCFPGATLVACTRHLKENLYRNAEKVSLHVD